MCFLSGSAPPQYPPETIISEGLSSVWQTVSGDTPLPFLQTPSAGHCLDTHVLLCEEILFQVCEIVADSFRQISATTPSRTTPSVNC